MNEKEKTFVTEEEFFTLLKSTASEKELELSLSKANPNQILRALKVFVNVEKGLRERISILKDEHKKDEDEFEKRIKKAYDEITRMNKENMELWGRIARLEAIIIEKEIADIEDKMKWDK